MYIKKLISNLLEKQYIYSIRHMLSKIYIESYVNIYKECKLYKYIGYNWPQNSTLNSVYVKVNIRVYNIF